MDLLLRLIKCRPRMNPVYNAQSSSVSMNGFILNRNLVASVARLLSQLLVPSLMSSLHTMTLCTGSCAISFAKSEFSSSHSKVIELQNATMPKRDV